MNKTKYTVDIRVKCPKCNHKFLRSVGDALNETFNRFMLELGGLNHE